MKKLIVAALFASLLVSGGYAQNRNEQRSNKEIEKDRDPYTKKGFNLIMKDALKDSDGYFAKYIDVVQQVWDKTSTADIGKEADYTINDLDAIYTKIIDTPVYIGGAEYKQVTLEYIVAVKGKVENLKKFGMLGADLGSELEEYNKASKNYDVACEYATDKRNEFKEKMRTYERTFLYQDNYKKKK